EEVARARTRNDFDEYVLTGDDHLPDAAPEPSEEMLAADIQVGRVYELCEMHTRHYDLIVRGHHQPEYQKHLSDWEKGIEWVRKQPRNGIVTLRQLRHALPDLPLSVFYEYREGDYPKLTFKTFSNPITGRDGLIEPPERFFDIKTTAKEEYEKVETLTIDRLRLIKICSIFVAQYGLRAFS